jgi:menaquinone-dependent protoporphyrinogen IX oxidase
VLSKHPLRSNPKYYALSYVYGDAKATKNILVNGQSFAATTNLVAALEVLAGRFNETKFIWVDAICINETTSMKEPHKLG